jgi:Protein of unknown function (DUF992)
MWRGCLRKSGWVLVLGSLLCAKQAQAQTPLANVGTLTCTTSDTAPQPTADAKLSCRFNSLATGREGGFEGYIARKGQADLPPGKRVLVWAVFASKPGVELSALAGKYVGDTGGQTAGRLKGGESNNIVLQPFTITSQVGDRAVSSVLELRLDPVKA